MLNKPDRLRLQRAVHSTMADSQAFEFRARTHTAGSPVVSEGDLSQRARYRDAHAKRASTGPSYGDDSDRGQRVTLEDDRRHRYTKITMSAATRDAIRRQVLKYVADNGSASIGTMTGVIQQQENLAGIHDSDVRAVVQPMIATGKLDYAPGLKIKLGTARP